MELPVAWRERTNASAPENTIKSERPGDWTHAAISHKYRPEDLVDEDSTAPLGWSKRHNAKTLDELAQSTSASVVAVAEVHEGTTQSSIFKSSDLQVKPQPQPQPQPAPTLQPLSSDSTYVPGPGVLEILSQIQQTQEQQGQLLTMLAGAVLKVDSKLNGLEARLKELGDRLGAR